MKEKRTRTKLFTPAGKAVQAVGLTMLFAAIVGFLLAKITSWFNADTNELLTLAIAGYNVWLAGEVLCLYGGHWSQRTRVWLIITTVVVCIPLLLIVLSYLWNVSPGTIILALLVGNILEYRVAGRMRKEAQQVNNQQ